MQRVQALSEALDLIAEVRNEMNAFLAKHPHITDGKNGYIYLNDESKRLYWLQVVVGAPLMDRVIGVNLLDLFGEPYTHLTEENLNFIIESLDFIAMPIDNFPPLKKQFKENLFQWKVKLLMAGMTLGFEFNADTPDSVKDKNDTSANDAIESPRLQARCIKTEDDYGKFHSTTTTLFFNSDTNDQAAKNDDDKPRNFTRHG